MSKFRIATAVLASLLVSCAPRTPIPGVSPELVRLYSPPGPPGDPWGPFVREAAAEQRIPEELIYAVMYAESRGCQFNMGRPMTSVRGEAGLMQIPPSVYPTIRRHVDLGPDPWLPRDNIRGAA